MKQIVIRAVVQLVFAKWKAWPWLRTVGVDLHPLGIAELVGPFCRQCSFLAKNLCNQHRKFAQVCYTALQGIQWCGDSRWGLEQ